MSACVCVDSTLRPAAVLLSPGESPEQEELDIRTLHLLRATVHNEERKLPENWEENPAEHKKYSIPYTAGDSTFGKKIGAYLAASVHSFATSVLHVCSPHVTSRCV